MPVKPVEETDPPPIGPGAPGPNPPPQPAIEAFGQSFGARLDAALTASEFNSADQDKIAIMFRNAFEAAKREP
jgi:hypothetical protein